MAIYKKKNKINISNVKKNIWSVAKINLLRWKGDLRIWIVFLFIGLLLFHEVSGFTRYGLDTGEKCSIYLLPVLFHTSTISVGTMKMMLYLGCLLLLCDAPFIYNTTPYIVLRSSRECWWLGECLYILITTFFYTMFIMLITTLVVLPVAEYGKSWGGVIQSFAFGDKQYGPIELINLYGVYMKIPKSTIGWLYPDGAQLYTFLTVWCSFFLLGLIQYLVSLCSKSMFLGFASAGILVFLDPIFTELSIMRPFRFVQMLSPVCWVSTDNLNLVDAEKVLTIPYIILMFAILIVSLLIIIRMVSKKIMIEVRGEV